MRMKIFVWALLTLCAVTGTAAASIPGAHRALCPSCFGMTEIADEVFIDTQNPEQAARSLAIVSTAKSNVEAYLGEWNAYPRILICTKTNGPCAKLLGSVGPRGTAWGAQLVKLAPLGLNETIATHELFHSELHYRMGAFGRWTNSIPRWFNEGLATHMSKDARFTNTHPKNKLDFVRDIVSVHDWKRTVNENTWPMIYGASAQNVSQIEAKIGIEGIRTLIERVTEGGEDFDTVLSELQR